MPRTLTPTQASAILAQDTAEVFLACVTITLGDAEPMRIVNNTESVMRLAGEFVPYPFAPEFPEDTGSPAGGVALRIDNIDREVTRLVRAYDGIPLATLELITASEPDAVIIGPCEFSVLGSEYDEMAITLSLGHEEDFLNQRVPAQTYSPSNSPGLWP